MMIKTSDLRLKNVIEINDGKKLGNISDIEFDLETGKITGIVVPGYEKFLGFFHKGEDVIIPWEKINKIGSDVILVNARVSMELKK